MRIILALPVALGVFAAAGPALADTTCREEITTLQRRLDSQGAQAVAGAGKPASETPANPSMGLDKAPAGKASDKDDRPSSSGVKEARDLVARAGEQDKAGNAKGCRDTIMQAKEKAGALP